jgi:twitching motility protein PilJ
MLNPISFLRSLKVWQKLALVTGTLLIPIAVLGYLLTSNVGELSDFITKELAGVEYLNPLARLQHAAVNHRSTAYAFAKGDASFRDALPGSQRDVDEALKAIEAVEAKHGKTLQTAEKWKAVKDAWSEVKGLAASTKPDDVMKRNGDFVDRILDLSGQVGDISNLIYDPINVSYALQDNMVYRIPTLVNYLDQARAMATGIAIRKTITPEQKIQLAFLKGQIDVARGQVKTNVDLLNERGTPELKARVDKQYAAGVAATDEFLKQLDTAFIGATTDVTMTPRDVTYLATSAIEAYTGPNAVFEATSPALVDVLTKRQAGHTRTQVYGVAAIFIGTLVALLLSYVIARGLVRQTLSLNRTFAGIGMGDFAARAEVSSGDELGTVAMSLNAMLDNTVALIQSQEERDAIQNSVMKLLDEVSGVGDGDLTKEAEVTADAMGAVADSFNYMISQLRDIISNVQRATRQVTGSANDIYQSAQTLAQGSEQQAVQIVNTSAAVDEMAISIQQVSENAGVSAQVAQNALENAKQGNDAVRNTIAGMDRIRDQVQETAKRIKRLGESSQEIGQIVQLIDDIADRTSILALNASIQAAMAGEAGRGFAVVAEEVERLADRSTDATKKISNLVKTIQSETNEAVSAMEKGIQEVVDGSRLAGQAGQSLHEIEAVSNKLADLIQSISLSAKQQARASEGVARSMTEISQITQSTATGTKSTAVQVRSLSKLAQDLRGSVARFKLPDGKSSDRDFSPQSMAEIVLHNGIDGHANGHANGNGNGIVKSGSRF